MTMSENRETTTTLQANISRMDLDHHACYRAIALRDARFDGRFFTAVKTTGFYLICDQALDAPNNSDGRHCRNVAPRGRSPAIWHPWRRIE